MSDKQIFIAGTGRSGTTILKQILGRHSQIYPYTEIRFLTDINGILDVRHHISTDWNHHNASQSIVNFIQLFNQEIYKHSIFDKVIHRVFREYLGGSGKKYKWSSVRDHVDQKHMKKCLDNFISDITIDSVHGSWIGSESYDTSPLLFVTRELTGSEFDSFAAQFIDSLLSYPLNGTGKTCWCDDTPANLLHIDKITKILPDSFFIHIYRHPLDVVSSYVHQKWAPDDPEYAALWVNQILAKWFKMREVIPSSRFIEIKYEDLVENKEEVLSRLMNSMDLDYEESLLSINLNSSSIGRYKSDLTADQIKRVEQIVSPILREYDY